MIGQTVWKFFLLTNCNGNPKLTILTVYSPTEGDSIEHAEEFHEEVRRAVTSTPAHNILLVYWETSMHTSARRVMRTPYGTTMTQPTEMVAC